MGNVAGGFVAEQYPPLKKLPDGKTLQPLGHSANLLNGATKVCLNTGHVIVHGKPQPCREYGGAALSSGLAFLRHSNLNFEPLLETKATRRRIPIPSTKKSSFSKKIVSVGGIISGTKLTDKQLDTLNKVFGLLGVLYEPDEVFNVRKKRYPLGSVVMTDSGLELYLIPFNLLASPGLWKICSAIFGCITSKDQKADPYYRTPARCYSFSLPDEARVIIQSRDKEAAQSFLKDHVRMPLSGTNYKHCNFQSTGALFSMTWDTFSEMHSVPAKLEDAWLLDNYFQTIASPMLQWDNVIERWLNSNASKGWKTLS